MRADNKPENDPIFMTFHTPEGKPFSIRREFFISALSANVSKHDHTRIAVDEGNETAHHLVREGLTDIKGPFADLGWVKINPAYVVGTSVREKDGKYNIDLRTPDGYGFNSSNSDMPQQLERAVINALREGPC